MHVPARQHSVFIDWLRFAASVAVVIRHARPDHWVKYDELAAGGQTVAAWLLLFGIRFGHEAVVVFFVLSGYLIGGNVIRRCQKGTFSAADYFRDRFVRIYTPLIPALVLTLACVWRVNGGLPDGYGLQMLGNLFQMQGLLCERLEGNAPLWTLGYEVWFYMLAGALAMLFGHASSSGRGGRFVMASLLALFATWCLVVLDTSYLFCWLLGAGAAVCPMKTPRRSVTVAGIVVLALTGAGIKQFSEHYSGDLAHQAKLLHSLGNLMVGAAVALALPILVRIGARFQTSRVAGWGPKLAASSYTLYLTHFPLLLVMRSLHEPYAAITGPSLLLYAGKIAACMFVAWLLYLPFERNTRRIRGFIKERWPSATNPAPTHA